MIADQDKWGNYGMLLGHEDENRWLKILGWILAFGLFAQLSSKVWMESGSARSTQTYIWLLLPALIYFLYSLISRRHLNFSFEYIPWVLFLFWVALSTLWSTGSEHSHSSLMKRGLYISIYLISILLLMGISENLLRRALLAGIAVIAIGALVSLIYQFKFLEQPLAYRAFRIDRSGIGNFANYGWPVVAGILHGAIATWALGIALDRRTSNRLALFWLIAFTILTIYVFLTYARGAWFGLIVSCLAVVFIQNSRRGWLFLTLSLLAVLTAVFLWWDYLVIEATERQLSGRGPIWEFFFLKIQGHWLFGYGLGTPFNYIWPDEKYISPHAHSLYLQQIYDSGVISLVLMATGVISLTLKAWQTRNNPWVRLAFPALIFALIAMLTDVERIFTRPGDYWTVFWLPVAILLAVPKTYTPKKL